MKKFLKQFVDVWKGKTFIDSVMQDFHKMMFELYNMFEPVTILLFQHKSMKGIEKKIYNEDIFVNKSERKIRKRVIEHLAVQPGIDIGPSLVMMSIVKDAERIGDFCKNLFELYRMFKKFKETNKYYRPFKEMRDNISIMIKDTDIAFRKSLDDKARDIIDSAYKIEKRCDEVIYELAESKLPTNEAVCLTLLSRYFKRIASHLSNIATAVVYPVHHIDFVKNKLDKNKL